MHSGWQKVNNEHPCPICRKPDWCRVSADGAVALCGRIEQGSFQKAKGNGGWLHRLSDKPQADYIGQAYRGDGKGTGVAKLYATAEDAIRAAQHQAGGELGGVWTYQYGDGGEALKVARFNLPDGDKSFRPIHPKKGKWAMGDPAGKLPLFRLLHLTGEKLAVVVEGEKAADAAAEIDLPATTSAHGSAAAEKTDWGPLENKSVVILPDNDDPGREYARDVARLAFAAGAAGVKIVTLPGLPVGGDIVEYIAAGGTREKMIALADTTPWMDRTELVGGPVLRRLSDVQAEEVAWLWRGRFAMGKINLIGGVPGVGKSWLSEYIAAAVSRGLPWADGRGSAPLGDVIIANAEDGAADTIKPRLVAMGADCSRIHVLDCVKRPDGDGRMIERGFTLADVDALEAAFRLAKDPRVVIIDPVSAHLASADENRNGEVRGLLKPIAKLAEKYGVAVICVTHLTKAGTTNAVNRMIGSIAFAGAARAVWLVGRDKANPERRLMLLAKCNIARDEGGLAFGIVDGAVAFEAEPVTQSADELLAEEADGEGPGRPDDERQAAESWLREYLADGLPHAVVDVKQAARDAGVSSERTLRRVAAALKVDRKLPGFGQGWTWRLPQSGQRSGQNPIHANSGQTGQTEETS